MNELKKYPGSPTRSLIRKSAHSPQLKTYN